VRSTHNGGTSTVSFTSRATRVAGATGNFTLINGTQGAGGTNNITIGGELTAQLLDRGLFYNGSQYAAYDEGGFVRWLIYGTDADAPASIPSGATLGVNDVRVAGCDTAMPPAASTDAQQQTITSGPAIHLAATRLKERFLEFFGREHGLDPATLDLQDDFVVSRQGDRLALVAPVSLAWELLHHAALSVRDWHIPPDQIAMRVQWTLNLLCSTSSPELCGDVRDEETSYFLHQAAAVHRKHAMCSCGPFGMSIAPAYFCNPSTPIGRHVNFHDQLMADLSRKWSQFNHSRRANTHAKTAQKHAGATASRLALLEASSASSASSAPGKRTDVEALTKELDEVEAKAASLRAKIKSTMEH
jgi:hypothetical protein